MSDDVTDAPDSDPTFTRREQLLEFVMLNRPEHPYWVRFVSLGTAGLLAGTANILFGSIQHDQQALVIGVVASVIGLTSLPIGLRLRWIYRNDGGLLSSPTSKRETRPSVQSKRRP